MNNETWRILIADDNPDDRLETQRALLNGSQRYYQFHEVETGFDCLGVLENTRQDPFDCLLLDYHLPDRDAPEILRLLAARGGLPCPVVVMTGVTERQMGFDVIHAGAQDFIGKEWINPESLTRAIENAKDRQALLADRQRIAEALKISENRLRSIFEASGDAIGLLGPEGFMECNPATLRLFGCASERDFLGKQPLDFSPPTQPGGAESRVLAAENIDRVKKEGMHRFEWRHRRLDGTEFDVDIVLTLIELPEGRVIQSITRDITERKRMELALCDSQRRLSMALDAANAGTWESVPETGEFTASNRALSMHGLVLDTLMNHEMAISVVHPEDQQMLEATLRQALEDGKPFQAEYRVPLADGSMHWILTSGELHPEFESPRFIGLVQNITQQKQMQLALQQSEQRYRALFESNRDGIALVDTEGRIQHANRAYQKILGYSLEELRTLTFQELTPARWQESERKLLQERMLHAGDSGEYEQECIHRRGAIVPISVRSWPLHDAQGQLQGMCRIIRDISERKRIEDLLKESESRFRVLFESSGNAIALLDQNGYFECNNECLHLFGCATKDEFLGKGPDYFSPSTQPGGGDSLKLASQFVAQAYQMGQTTFEWVHQTLDGTLFDAEVSLVPIELNGRLILHSTARDITERKRMSIALSQAKDEADRANKAKSFFLANMSHEIRTPMNAIMCSAELCLEETLTEVQRAFLIKIQKASETLLHLIDDILDFSKVEAGKLEMSREAFSLAGVFDNLALIFEAKAMEKGLDLIFMVSTGLECTFLGDPRRLGQVLINLIGNAIKFTSAGRVEIEVVEESRSQEASLLRFSVTDQGIGISPESLSQLFQPFIQADTSITRNYGGTGLGLSLSKRLVDMMGGEIWAESTPGEGSAFHFTARFDISEALIGNENRGQSPLPETEALAALVDKEILLVEDNDFNQELIGEVLKRAGCRVRVAENGLQAIELVRQSRPDAILMDCQMPVMDGFEATRLLRDQEGQRTLPIIALTANAMLEDKEKCLQAGMNDFVSKPVRKDDLLATLAGWIITDGKTVPPLELPGLDTRLGLSASAGQWPPYLKRLGLFREAQAVQFQTEFREALILRNWAQASRLTHSLKDAARALGAVTLVDLAENLMHALQAQSLVAVNTALAPLEQELDKILVGLAELDRKPGSDGNIA